jgi:hypothetical protein
MKGGFDKWAAVVKLQPERFYFSGKETSHDSDPEPV